MSAFSDLEFSVQGALISTGMGLFSAAEDIAQIGSKAGRDLSVLHTTEAGRMLAKYRWDPARQNIGRAFRTAVLRGVGKGLTGVGILTSVYDNFYNEPENSTRDAFVETGVEVTAGVAAGIGTGLACAATAVVGCLAVGAGLAVASAVGGSYLGEVASDAVDATAEFLDDTSEAIGSGLSAAGDALGSGLESAGDFLGDIF